MFYCIIGLHDQEIYTPTERRKSLDVFVVIIDLRIYSLGRPGAIIESGRDQKIAIELFALPQHAGHRLKRTRFNGP